LRQWNLPAVKHSIEEKCKHPAAFSPASVSADAGTGLPEGIDQAVIIYTLTTYHKKET
jgi:hypothetical protein